VFFNTLAPEGVACSKQRKKRAKLRASLPAPFGCSLFHAADQCKAAWLSSLAACLSDPLLFRLRFGLQRFVEPAWENLVGALGGVNSKHWPLVSQLLPTTAAGFLDGSMFCPTSELKIKFSKVILKLLSRLRVEKFFSLTSVENLSLTLTEADILRAQAPTLAGRIFTTSLRFDSPFVFTNEQYLAWTRAFLGLPPASTLGNHVEHKDFDYPVQKCLAEHHGGKYLDVDGCHASAQCPSAAGGRMKKHNFLARVIARMAKEAGLRVNVEPDTFGLLLGEFSKSECKRIFPKRVDKQYRDRFQEVLNAIEFVAAPTCDMDEVAKRIYIQAYIDALPPVKTEDSTGLRIDVAIENDDTGETKWVDVTAVHTGADSYKKKELKALANRQIAAQISANMAIPDPLKSDPSPALVERTTMKNAKYSRLLLVAKKQAAEKKRKQVPSFCTFAVSDYGEMSPAAVDLQEWLVNQFKIKCEQAGRRADGCKSVDLVRDFRHRLRIGVQMAVAAGCGEMLCRAGQAWK
jgi:hypothetical protein